MAWRLFGRLAYGRTTMGTVSLGGVAIASSRGNSLGGTDDQGSCVMDTKISAADMFAMSSQYCVPSDWGSNRTFKIRNDYPSLQQVRAEAAKKWPQKNWPTIPGPDMPTYVPDAPWFRVDFKKDPLTFCQIIKEYCWEGNVNNEFVVQNNTVIQNITWSI